jgi:hypothetical protein
METTISSRPKRTARRQQFLDDYVTLDVFDEDEYTLPQHMEEQFREEEGKHI